MQTLLKVLSFSSVAYRCSISLRHESNFTNSANRETLAARLLKNMDSEVEPCDDFYDFACGGFLKSTIIPDDKTSVNTFTEISDELQNQLRASIEEKSSPDEPKPFRLAKNLYKACMNKSEYIHMYLDWLSPVCNKQLKCMWKMLNSNRRTYLS